MYSVENIPVFSNAVFLDFIHHLIFQNSTTTFQELAVLPFSDENPVLLGPIDGANYNPCMKSIKTTILNIIHHHWNPL
jgi:hypothetical protein